MLPCRSEIEIALRELGTQSRRVLPVLLDSLGRAYIEALQLVTSSALEQLGQILNDYPHSFDSLLLEPRTAKDILLRSQLEHSHTRVEDVKESFLRKEQGRLINQLNAGLVSKKLIQKAGAALCKTLIRRNYRRQFAAHLLNKLAEESYEHIAVMRRVLIAQRNSSSCMSYNFKDLFAEAFELKHRLLRKVPKLILIHDIDRNLVPDDSHYDQFPHKELYFRAQELHHKLNLNHAEVRFAVLSIFGALHAGMADRWYAKLCSTSRTIHDTMFNDARELLTFAARDSSTDVESYFVTGNSSIVAAHLALGLGIPEAHVWGIDESSVDGFDKHIAILEVAYKNPDAIIVVSDDGDSEIVRCFRQQYILPSNKAVTLSDLAFFVARTPALAENDIFPLHSALSQSKTPFLQNVRTDKGNLGEYGYQGMSQIHECYKTLILQEKVRMYEYRS